MIKTHAKHACLITDSMWYTKTYFDMTLYNNNNNNNYYYYYCICDSREYIILHNRQQLFNSSQLYFHSQLFSNSFLCQCNVLTVVQPLSQSWIIELATLPLSIVACSPCFGEKWSFTCSWQELFCHWFWMSQCI